MWLILGLVAEIVDVFSKDAPETDFGWISG
jgi:hypothetical protein